ncbi:hypothetical protein GMJAKD_06465 [Candidatus Electrothrix aarhusensis]
MSEKDFKCSLYVLFFCRKIKQITCQGPVIVIIVIGIVIGVRARLINWFATSSNTQNNRNSPHIPCTITTVVLPGKQEYTDGVHAIRRLRHGKPHQSTRQTVKKQKQCPPKNATSTCSPITGLKRSSAKSRTRTCCWILPLTKTKTNLIRSIPNSPNRIH